MDNKPSTAGRRPFAIGYRPSWLRKHLAIPAEHGAWAMLLGPFGAGLGLARKLDLAVLWALLGVLLVFLARQPLGSPRGNP